MIVNISELEKGNGELCMAHGNLNITMVYLILRPYTPPLRCNEDDDDDILSTVK